LAELFRILKLFGEFLFMSFVTLFVAACCVLLSLRAFSQYHLVKQTPKIFEIITSYHDVVDSKSVSSDMIISLSPENKSFAQFGGMIPSDHAFLHKNVSSRSICGPSGWKNTLNCFDLNQNGQFLGSYPLPGRLSARPLFVDDPLEPAWLLATKKGFLMRIDARPQHKLLPHLTQDFTRFWGSFARKYMSSFRPKIFYTEGNSSKTVKSDESLVLNSSRPQGMRWIFASSSEFIGTPVVKNGYVYAVSTSFYLQAFEWQTGKLVWAFRLSPENNLKLTPSALLVTTSELFIGTKLGNLLVLNPKTGSLLWSLQISNASDQQKERSQLFSDSERLSSVVARPLLLGRQLIVSNVENMTQNISLDTKTVLWSYPVGSVAQAQAFGGKILIASVDGRLVSLDKETGRMSWSSQITADASPLASLILINSHVVLVSSFRGQLFAVNLNDGHILAQNKPIGEVNGEFFPGYGRSQACLSFAYNGFRCFYTQLN
jgi:outer membrane protein assembly factor BamB